MANTKQFSSSNPGCIIIMLDKSGSMLNSFENGESRTVFSTKAVNRMIDNIIQKNFDGVKPKNRCFIAVIGYNHKVSTLAAGYLSDLDANPLRVEQVQQKITDGAGGYITIDKNMPVWVEPTTEDGTTNMKGAFEMAKQLIDKWISDNPDSPAPVIINISDGVPYFNQLDVDVCQQQTIEVVNTIKAIDTEDGKVQIFNAMIGNGPKTVFPVNKSDVNSPEAEFLYDISTEIPDSYRAAADKHGFSYEPGARGLICQCDGVELISLIDFGSSKGQCDR